ncbi:ActS/PrrB/RegB family redox-sensitive histidine kinase [Kiloniella majae]|uniref:ActS/PrrB/RegB family redox-sensitive histidine kinase n=1 Tax=Kiloniella majae TaxID=1938558 RepID=UPI000A2785C6|nr:ActS/PrrB/RegB family redox-sensitive histidine kinase [Kiloniella majae]
MSSAFRLEPEVGLHPDQGRVRLRTLVFIRWMAICGQTAALLIAHFGLGLELPLVAAFLVVLTSGVLNVAQVATRPASSWLRNKEATMALAFDLIQISVLLSLTGGLTNPFSILILGPVTVSASILTRRSTICLSILAIVAVTADVFFYLPLPWPEGSFFLHSLYLYGLWAALVFTAIFLAVYVSSLTEEARSMGMALVASQMALAREQKLSALGGLAAAAAHELGSPLGTMLVVAKEMKEELPPDDIYVPDVELLISEILRCREILQNLAAWPEEDGGDPYNFMPIQSLVEAAVAPYEKLDIQTIIEAKTRENSGEESGIEHPMVERSPEILHSLGLFAQNAIQFAKEKVDISLIWDQRTITLTIHDDGPGFDQQVLGRLGDPLLSNRESAQKALGQKALVQKNQDRRKEEDGDHMGLGVFIATTLLSHTGGKVTYFNHETGGAVVEIVWPRHRLEVTAQSV